MNIDFLPTIIFAIAVPIATTPASCDRARNDSSSWAVSFAYFRTNFKTFNGGYLQTFATFVVVLKHLVILIGKVNSCGYFVTSLQEELLG